MRGKIVKAIAGFYYVYDGNEIYMCRARGLFRNQDVKPLVGDNVTFDITHEQDKEGFVTQVIARTNEVARPSVANIDCMLCFFAMKDPEPSILHISRLLLQAEAAEIPAALVMNKADLVSKEKCRNFFEAFKGTGYDIRFISVKERTGITALREILAGRTSVLAGPSGAGKSSFLNLVIGKERMITGGISEKKQRGRHTTRHTELFYLGDDSFLMDTPGFSALENELEPEEIKRYFPEFSRYEIDCRFEDCVHINEIGCAVIHALRDGKISEERYEAYQTLYKERKNAKKY